MEMSNEEIKKIANWATQADVYFESKKMTNEEIYRLLVYLLETRLFNDHESNHRNLINFMIDGFENIRKREF